MADELQDNLLLDDSGSITASDGVSVDGDNDEGVAVAGIASDDEDVYSDLDAASNNNNNKQKQLTEAESKENKKRKRKEKEKAKKQKRAALAAEFAEGIGSVATQPPDMQADYLSAKQRSTFPKLSSLELQELRLTEAMLIDTTSFDQPRKEESLAAFVRKYAKNAVEAFADASSPVRQKPGHPGVLVLTGNAQRAADLAKALRSLNPSPQADKPEASGKPPKKKLKTQGAGAKPSATVGEESGAKGSFTVGKLFARHFKLKEHQAWLQEHVCPLASGTPQRVGALVASDALNLESLEAIVIDQTWVDAKQRTVFDTPETRDELIKLLTSEKVMAALKRTKNPVKLLLF
ncbi:Protein cms1 [Thecaphora frezii]